MSPWLRKTVLLIFSAIFLLGCLQSLLFVAKSGWFHTSFFLKNHGRYSEIRALQPGSDIALSAKQVLPPGSTVSISPGRDKMTRVALRYELYPVRTVRKGQGDYVLELNPSLSPAPAGWSKRDLSGGAVLYAAPGAHFLDQPLPQPALPFSRLLIFMLGYAAVTCTCGFLILSGLGAVRPEHTFPRILSLSFLTGYLALTLAQWAYLMAGGILQNVSILLVTAIALLCSLLFHQKCGSPQTLCCLLRERPRPVFQLSSVALALIVAAIFSAAVLFPVKNWDAMAHWLLKAKLLYALQQPVFFDTHHNYYPLLWPLNVAMQYTLLGGVFDQTAKWTSGLFFLALLGRINAGMTAMKVPSPARKAAIVFYLLAFFNDPLVGWWKTNFTFANAENIFTAYAAGLASALVLWLRTRERSAFGVSLLMAIGLCAVKLEGVIMVLALVPCLIWIAKDDSGKRWQPLLFLAALIIPLAWMGFSRAQGYWSGFYHFQDPLTLHKVRLVCLRFVKVILASRSLLVVMFAAGWILLFGKRRKWTEEERFLLLWAGVLTAVIGLSFFGWPEAKIIADLPDVAARRFLHLTPLLTLFWAGRMFAPGKD